MPPGPGKRLLRCSIAEPIYLSLVTEAKQRHMDMGYILEARLQDAPRPAATEPLRLDAITQQLAKLEEQHMAMLTVLEQLLTVLAGSRSQAGREEAVPPVATYEDLYRAEPAPEPAPIYKPRTTWRLFSSSKD